MNMQVSVESIRNEPGGWIHCDLPVDMAPFRLRGVDISVVEGSTLALDVYNTDDGWHLAAEGEVAIRARCSRCLEEAEIRVPVEFSVEIPESGSADDSDDGSDEETIPRITRGGYLDVHERVREEVLLAIPLRILCDPDCRGLCPVCGVNLNETTCDCERNPIDPRLAALEKLKETLSDG